MKLSIDKVVVYENLADAPKGALLLVDFRGTAERCLKAGSDGTDNAASCAYILDGEKAGTSVNSIQAPGPCMDISAAVRLVVSLDRPQLATGERPQAGGIYASIRPPGGLFMRVEVGPATSGWVALTSVDNVERGDVLATDALQPKFAVKVAAQSVLVNVEPQ